MMREAVKRILAPVGTGPVGRTVARQLNHGPAIIGYHGVAERVSHPGIESLQVDANLFEQQMTYLKKHYQVISLDYLSECLASGYDLDQSQIVITFDDGYKNVADVAAPIMKSLDLPFAIFVTTHNISTGQRFAGYLARCAFTHCELPRIEFPSLGSSFDIVSNQARRHASVTIREAIHTQPMKIVSILIQDILSMLPEDRWRELNEQYHSEQPMTWDDVVRLHRAGAVIGSHCHDHALLHGDETDKEISRQLTISKELVEAKTGSCKYFVYPSGTERDISARAAAEVDKTGYALGISSVRGEVTGVCDSRILPRLVGSKMPMMLELQLAARSLFNRNYASWSASMRASLA